MPRPAEAAPATGDATIESPTGVALEGVHDKFGRHVIATIDHGVNMIRAHLRGKQPPIFTAANVTDGLKGCHTYIRINFERCLLECSIKVLAQFGARFRQPGDWHIVVAVDGSLLTWDM